MSESKFNLPFPDAMLVLIRGEGWVQGEHFKEGLYLSLDTSGAVLVQSADKQSGHEPFAVLLSKDLMMQKYRAVTSLVDVYDR